jgi:hypothetical protein
MFLTNTDWLAHQAHHKELLRIAEQERLARAALRAQPERQSLRCEVIDWIGARLLWWAWKQQSACGTRPSLTARTTAVQNCN